MATKTEQKATPTLYEQWRASCEDQDSPLADRYRKAAKRIHQVEGEVEVDDGAVVSYSEDHGAYVMAWVWVDEENVTEDGGDL